MLVSEVMLQQTPVARVLPAYSAWLARWPTPATLAADRAGDAIRQWDRLGYPRRALRLHAAATAMVQRHNGQVPEGLTDLLALPGVGEYTARAVASFAFGQRHAVVDTNVRRVLSRAVRGEEPGDASTAADLRLAESVLPAEPAEAVRTAVALMELGALVCTPRAPRCPGCPLAQNCRWRRSGQPALAPGPRARRPPAYLGTDRQARGALLARLRADSAALTSTDLLAVWADHIQAARALNSLVADGLAVRRSDARFTLP